MKTLLIMILGGAALLSTGARAADRDWTSYNDLLHITRLDKFYAAPAMQRDKVRVLGTMTPKNPAIAPSSIVFTVIHGEEKKRVEVGADGTFDPAIDAQWAKDNPRVITNMPPGEKAGFSFALVPLVPPGLQLDYAMLMASVQQSNALIRSQAGLLRFMLPTFTGIQMQYRSGQVTSVRISSDQGERTLSTDATGLLRLPLDEVLLRSNSQVTLQQRPQSFDFIAD